MKHYTVEWAFIARDDVEEIADYILVKDSAISLTFYTSRRTSDP